MECTGGSGTAPAGDGRDNDGSRALCNVCIGGAGDPLPVNGLRLGRSGCDSECGNVDALDVDNCFGDFSGLLGGVLNGETRSSETARSDLGAKEPPSWWANAAGLAGILGFAARFAGGGSDALFILRPDMPSSPTLMVSEALGDRWEIFCPVGTDEADMGEMARLNGRWGMAGNESRAWWPGLREVRKSWSRCTGLPSSRGGDRGESTVNVGASCGEERKFIDIGLLCRLPGNLPGDPPFLTEYPFVGAKPEWSSRCRSDVEAQGERERGKSSDARARKSSPGSEDFRTDNESRDWADEGWRRVVRFSKCDSNDDTGLCRVHCEY